MPVMVGEHACGFKRLSQQQHSRDAPSGPDDRHQSLVTHIWTLLKESYAGFFADEALTRGAAISFYTVTSIGPVLFIVVAIAGLAFGEKAATGAIGGQLNGLMGQQSADLLQAAIQGAAGKSSGVLATVFGIGMLVITASGVFTEMQQTLNVIWKAVPPETTISGLLRARALSLGLVGALGFLLLVSLVISTDPDSYERLHQRSSAIGTPDPSGAEPHYFLCPDCCSVRRHLQILARQADRVARCRGRGHRHGTAFHCGEVSDRFVSWEQHHSIELWASGRTDHRAPMGVLLGADIPPWRRVHESICPPSWEPGETKPLTRCNANPGGLIPTDQYCTHDSGKLVGLDRHSPKLAERSAGTGWIARYVAVRVLVATRQSVYSAAAAASVLQCRPWIKYVRALPTAAAIRRPDIGYSRAVW